MANPPPLVLFDDGLGLLSPLTDLRAAFDVRTGALTLRERLERSGQRIAAWMAPESIAPLIRERTNIPPASDLRTETPHLFLNGRCPLVPAEVFALAPDHAMVEERSGHIIAAHASPRHAAAVARSETNGLTIAKHADPALVSRPWDIRAFRDLCIAHDLALLLAAGGTALPSRDFILRIAPTAKAHPSAIFDTERGHILIDEHATIRPGAIIVGPAYIGPHTTVLERSLIKPNTAIGPWCKVAGEIGGTIFQGYANKAHEGHLGDSWVGEWANLGAGTTNSNLLNTYGEVIARPLARKGADNPSTPRHLDTLTPGSNERTGQQFLGATIGDHVKTAICTRIMTGAIIGTGAMFAATAPLSGTIPPFSWITDSGTKAFAIDKFIEVAGAAMARRGINPSAAYLGRLTMLCSGRA
jgi:acetyltransferase-like isoleucine patch superfamily enzyme